jgi:hypothetical protein
MPKLEKLSGFAPDKTENMHSEFVSAWVLWMEVLIYKSR